MAGTEIDSILDSVKKRLGLVPYEVTEFDEDLTDVINSALAEITQVGIGHQTGFAIQDDTATWSDFLGDDPRLNMARTYVYTQARLLFDPPQHAYLITALENKAKECLWRLQVQEKQT